MKELICINCPKGCHIFINNDEIKGYSCLRGLDYAKNELTNPLRNLSSTIKIKDSNLMCPVKSSKPLPKDKINLVMKEINKVDVSLPIKFHQVIIKNVLNLEADIISTKEID